MTDKSIHKWAFFLPNIFTALNMACGYGAIVFAMHGKYYQACMILVLACIFDLVDGRIARLTGTESSFGEQFDSMSDVISFGVAPSFLYYHRFLVDYGRPGLVIAFIYLLCGALRLARFNANIDKVSSDYFQGIPIPGAALSLIGFVLLSTEVRIPGNYNLIAVVILLLYSFLMVSNIPFPSFKNSEFVREKKRLFLLIIFLVLAFLFFYEEYTIGIFMFFYTFGSLAYFFKNKSKFQSIFDIEKDVEK